MQIIGFLFQLNLFFSFIEIDGWIFFIFVASLQVSTQF
jgi:hypothetical protein